MAKDLTSDFDPKEYIANKIAKSDSFNPQKIVEQRIAESKVSPDANVSPQYSKLESGLMGAGQSLSLGLGDEAVGAGKAALDLPEAMQQDETLEELKRKYKEYRDIERAKLKLAQEQNPMSYTAGSVVGAAPLAFVPGVNTLAGATIVGAATGLGTSEADLTDPSLENLGEAGKDVAIGGGLGLGISGIGKGLSAVSKLDPVKSIIQAGKEGLSGEFLVGEQARRGLGNRIVGMAKGTGEAISKEGKAAAQAKRALIDEAEASGRNIELGPMIDDLSARSAKMYDPLLAEQKAARRALQEPIDEALKSATITGGTEVPVKTVESLRKALGKLGYMKDLKDDEVVALAKSLSGKTGSILNESIEGLDPVNKKIQNLMDAQDIFNVGGQATDDLGNVKQLTPLIERIEKEGITGDIAREKFKQGIESLKAASPELGAATEKQFEELSRKYALAKSIGKEGSFSNRALTTRAGMGAANLVGYGLNKAGLKTTAEIAGKAFPLAMPSPVSIQTATASDVKEASTGKLSRNLYDMPLDSLSPIANELSQDPSLQAQSEALMKAIEAKDSKAKDRVLFTLMQNPKAREIMRRNAEEE